MGIYTSAGIISGAAQNDGQLITELNGLATKPKQNYVTSPTSITATSDTTIISDSDTLVADELVRLDYVLRFSVSATTTWFTITPYIGGVAIGPSLTFSSATTSTSGDTDSICGFAFSQDLSGSQNFEVKAARTAGSGTIYFGARRTVISRVKRGA